jgi:hypothetical protein
MRLLQFGLGFVLGCVVAGIAAVLLVPKWYYDYGRWIGVVEVGYKIPGALGNDVDPYEPKEIFLGGKQESVVIVTRNGVKTLRLCCDGSEPKPAQSP